MAPQNEDTEMKDAAAGAEAESTDFPREKQRLRLVNRDAPYSYVISTVWVILTEINSSRDLRTRLHHLPSRRKTILSGTL